MPVRDINDSAAQGAFSLLACLFALEDEAVSTCTSDSDFPSIRLERKTLHYFPRF